MQFTILIGELSKAIFFPELVKIKNFLKNFLYDILRNAKFSVIYCDIINSI